MFNTPTVTHCHACFSIAAKFRKFILYIHLACYTKKRVTSRDTPIISSKTAIEDFTTVLD